MTYSPEEVEKIKLYAKHRGVRIILELDSPSHAGAGWQWGDTKGLGNLAVCVDKDDWRKYSIQPPSGQLNPVNENTFNVLRDIYNDMLAILGTDSVIHLGGDEVNKLILNLNFITRIFHFSNQFSGPEIFI